MDVSHSKVEEVVEWLQSSIKDGLSDNVVKERLKRDGHNEIQKSGKRSILSILWEQFRNLLVVLLIAAGALSLYLGSYRDAIVLFSIVIVNALIGFWQELKSENILASISSLIVEKCITVRNGTTKEIPVNMLVKGDLVMLNEGDGVPADMRLIRSTGLMANEFILTGESQARDKNASTILDPELSSITDKENCIFMGTTISHGEAMGIVYATGMETEIGKIAKSSTEIVQDSSPLQREMNHLARRLTAVTLVLAALLFVSRMLLRDSVTQALVFSISVAAAMVPEGLPAQISIALSLGVQRLARRNAIVKRLSSVEALGAATIIASDKTGTITKNEMTITDCYFQDQTYEVTGSGFQPEGEIKSSEGTILNPQNLNDQKVLFISGYLASTAKVNPPDEFHKTWYAIGDPTECAFATLALKAGYNQEELDKAYPRVQLFPFDSVRKRMSIVRKHNGKHISFIKGSIESLMDKAEYINVHGKVRKINEHDISKLMDLSKSYAAKGLRVIALAYKDFEEPKINYSIHEAEEGITFSGFCCMIDPPHEDATDSIQAAFHAGIRVIMITGDNEITAAAIAKKIGLRDSQGKQPVIITEKQLHKMDEEKLRAFLNHESIIFSRVSPDEKLKIVTLLKEKGDIVAVTGDGVNDTLSLKKSDIGVAMGLKGSKIAQEAATLVLLDDNFSTIVYAIKEGRTIFKNIRKNVIAVLASNLAELLCVIIGFIGVFFNFPAIILAIHILLIDLIGEMLPLLALSFDPSQQYLMHEPPRKPGQMIDKEVITSILAAGFFRGGLAVWVFFQVLNQNEGVVDQYALALTSTFATIIITQFVNIFVIRTPGSVFSRYSFTNPYLFGGITLSAIIMGLIIYLPFFNDFLHTAPLSINDLKYPGIAAIVFLVVFEIVKWLKNKIDGKS